MRDLKLARIDPVRLTTEGTRWEQRQGRGRSRHPGRATSARSRLLAALLPGRDPETCDVALDVDPAGVPVGLVVRDAGTGEVLLRLSLDQVERTGCAGQGGLFFERRT
jgi:hypothetical protein